MCGKGQYIHTACVLLGKPDGGAPTLSAAPLISSGGPSPSTTQAVDGLPRIDQCKAKQSKASNLRMDGESPAPHLGDSLASLLAAGCCCWACAVGGDRVFPCRGQAGGSVAAAGSGPLFADGWGWGPNKLEMSPLRGPPSVPVMMMMGRGH
jgi:hypothetical protein